MLLTRSPTLTFALLFSILSICLTIFTFNIPFDDSKDLMQLLIICPPLNCIFVFLLSATWVERRFRLSYIPFICLVILMCSSILLTIISSLFFSLSIIIYFNFIYHFFFSILFLSIIIIVMIAYFYGSLCIHRHRNMMTIEQQNSDNFKEVERIQIDELTLKSSKTDEELNLFMSILPGRRIRRDIRNIQDDLNHIQVHTIITLNESKELSFMNMTNKNIYNMDIYSSHVKRANIEHIKYPIRDRFIPKSISDYIQFIYSIILHVNRFDRNRILVHCMGGMGRTGMTIVCLELVFEYLTKGENKQRLIERFCHYPFLFSNSCRVCQAISNVRQARTGTIHNPLQIIFVHEFYARLKSSSYMQEIKHFFARNENLLSNNHEECYSRQNTTSNNHVSF